MLNNSIWGCYTPEVFNILNFDSKKAGGCYTLRELWPENKVTEKLRSQEDKESVLLHVRLRHEQEAGAQGPRRRRAQRGESSDAFRTRSINGANSEFQLKLIGIVSRTANLHEVVQTQC
jgi:hypothetical protein